MDTKSDLTLRMVVGLLVGLTLGGGVAHAQPAPAEATPAGTEEKPDDTKPDDAAKKDDKTKPVDDDKPMSFAGTTADDLKSGKLIRYGITAGVAGAALWQRHDHIQKSLATATMPYVAVFPAWWTPMGDATRAYCAASWLGSDPVRDATAIAISDTVTALSAEGDSKILLAAVQQAALGQIRFAGLSFRRVGERALDTPPQLEELYKQDRPLAVAATILKYSGWNVMLAGRCSVWRRFGVYLGLPATFSTNARLAADLPIANIEFKPTYSFGLAIAPVSAISLLIGVTRSRVLRDLPKGKDEPDRAIGVSAWSFTVAVGGNLDLLSSLLGGGK
jgi:hypothetical protein